MAHKLQAPSAVIILLSIILLFPGICSTQKSNASCSLVLEGKDNGTFYGLVTRSSFGNKDFCNYAISVKRDQVSLKFTKVQLEVFGSSSLSDYVVIFDGADCMTKRIGVVYDKETPLFISSTNRLTALFMATNQLWAVGYKASYNTVSGKNATTPHAPSERNRILDNCGTNLTGESGPLSFNGSDMYNVLCIWKITVDPSKVVRLQVDELKLESSYSSLRVLDGDTCAADKIYLAQAFNEFRPFFIISSSNSLIVVFASPSGIPREKIKASYSSIRPSEVNQSFAVITTTPATTLMTEEKESTSTSTQLTQSITSSASSNAFHVVSLCWLSLVVVVRMSLS